MTKRKNSKYKLDRRLSENIWGRPKSPYNLRQYGPGQHGQKRSGKLSDFGIQLHAKQKLKGYYGNINERQFRNIYKKATMPERRLDTVVYRSKFVPTVFSARQFVNHGHVTVNGKKVNISSYLLKENDVVQVKEKSKQMAIVIETTKSKERDIPSYIAVDQNKLEAKFVKVPQLSEVPYPVKMEPNLVIEFYSSR